MKATLKKNNNALFALGIVLAGAVAWSNSLSGPYVFDDMIYVSENEFIRDLSNFLDFSGPRYFGFLSFALNYALSGPAPFGFHLANLFIHILNSLLVFYFLLAVFNSPRIKDSVINVEPQWVCLAAALIFLLHPVQTQAVTYISQRFTSLAAFFYFVSVASYMQYGNFREDGKNAKGRLFYFLSIVSCIFALKTKETSFTLPLAIGLLEFTFFPYKGMKPVFSRTAPFMLTLAIIPLMLLSSETGGSNEAERFMSLKKLDDLREISRYEYLITQPSVILTYIRLLFVPVNQHFNYYYPLSKSILEPGTAFSAAVVLAVMSCAVFLYIRSIRRCDALLLLISSGIVWFFLAISIESSIIPIKDPINEHRVYLPSAGAVLAFVSFVFLLKDRIGNRMKCATFAAALIISTAPLLAAATYLRNEVWRDSYAIYADDLRKNSFEASTHLQMGVGYYERGMLEEAADEFRKATEIDSDDAPGHNNLAYVCAQLGLYDEAVKEYGELIRLKPGKAGPHFMRAVVYLKMGAIDDSVNDLERTLELNPLHKNAIRMLGYIRGGETDKLKWIYIR